MKFGEDFEIWKCERKIENYWKKLEIMGKKWRFRNEFGMKNDNWKYFGNLEKKENRRRFRNLEM